MRIDIPALITAIFVCTGLVGVVTSVAQYAVRTYPPDNDMRMWLVVAAFVGYMSLFLYVVKAIEHLLKSKVKS